MLFRQSESAKPFQTVEKPQGGVGGAAAPPTSIRIRRLCRRGGLLIVLAKSIPYKFGRLLVDRVCLLEKQRKPFFRHAAARHGLAAFLMEILYLY